jgi:hypothetical protein
MRKDGQADITKLIIVFRNFAKAPENALFHKGKKLFCHVTVVTSKGVYGHYKYFVVYTNVPRVVSRIR